MTHVSIDGSKARKDFPILNQQINGHPLVYLDNAATTQKPVSVIQALVDYYQQYNSNVHRSIHPLGERATLEYERARDKVKLFLGAKYAKECVFTRGTTEAINLVANSYVLPRLKSGDEILITHLEHHSNIVPWQLICEKTGATLKVAPINHDGEVNLEKFKASLSDKTQFVAISHISNALGTINPVKEMVAAAHAAGARVLVDGAQAAPHQPINVTDLDCDFYAISGHKMYGPTGIGVLWGRSQLLDIMVPYQGGGEMISSVSFDKTEYAPAPQKFEAGTPNVAGAIGLGAAVDYLMALDLAEISRYEEHLLEYATEAIRQLKGFNIVGTAKEKASIISFVHGKIHAHDIGTILSSQGIAVRSGHHCAMPIMSFFELPATTRVSFSFYNTTDDVDALVKALHKVKEVFV